MTNKETYTEVLNYITRNTRKNYFGAIVVPTVLLTAEALKLSLEDTDEVYTELLARGVLCEVSEYQYTMGGHFPLTDQLKQKLGSVLMM